jgi:hypothetical protein
MDKVVLLLFLFVGKNRAGKVYGRITKRTKSVTIDVPRIICKPEI